MVARDSNGCLSRRSRIAPDGERCSVLLSLQERGRRRGDAEGWSIVVEDSEAHCGSTDIAARDGAVTCRSPYTSGDIDGAITIDVRIIYHTNGKFGCCHARFHGETLLTVVDFAVLAVIAHLDGHIAVGQCLAHQLHLHGSQSGTLRDGGRREGHLQFWHVVILQRDDDLCLFVLLSCGIESQCLFHLRLVVVDGCDVDGCRLLTLGDGHRRWEVEALGIIACKVYGHILRGSFRQGDSQGEALALSYCLLGTGQLHLRKLVVLNDEATCGRCVARSRSCDDNDAIFIVVLVVVDDSDVEVCCRGVTSDGNGSRHFEAVRLVASEGESLFHISVSTPRYLTAHVVLVVLGNGLVGQRQRHFPC